MSNIEPTIEQIMEAIGDQASESRDGESVIVGYGPIGYLRIHPDSIIRDGEELPAVRIDGKLSRANGSTQSELREQLRTAGLEIR
ncbi:hypothetical protein [Natronospira bacteriovora]|uniref:Uncharacterized protein n=1 Tax=Natronospira bacteriovora TaxID=3069753 RepID=A0ABU0W5J7_9GAMM|nr:hypothetical protein [Natronospira sp. AB-CW4]MDQ2069297.1 hypothetical protein [Natronospira sp. AB-CW4]